jgi:hypothetical protein
MNNEDNFLAKCVSKLAAMANDYIQSTRPSEIVPFKLSEALLEPYRAEDYYRIIENTMLIDDCPDWVQTIINKGRHMYEIERGFKEFLESGNISVEDFKKMSSADKATELVRFFDSNSLTKECLKIN